MSKVRLLGRGRSLINSIYLVIIVLGIGCISWSMVSILGKEDYSKDYSIGITLASDKILYPKYPSEGDNIGSLTIPALKRIIPIIQGTGVNELKEGVGHFTQSVLPGEKDNCVLSGHRDTVFRQLGKLKIKDQLIVKTSAGTFTYEVNGTRIVDKDDKTVIVPTDNAILTMTTCYPFNFIGDAPDRYIVTATLKH
jgi:sortase A